MTLSAADFPAFFEAVHGVTPFPWQRRLVERLATGEGWPEVLDLPTASGKTAALDAAVFHLALEADQGEARRAPVRVAFVVDRRLVVDGAFERAKRIEEALAAPAHPVVEAVAARLRGFADDGRPLLARRLRGGLPREDDWARTPAQPTILCSTVDQVGSRLLFRGYGVSDSMKPVHAGLLGEDCLILLDEAHLSEPFRQTLDAVARLDRREGRRFRAVTLSATPGEAARDVFPLSKEDRAHPVLQDRLQASKPVAAIERAAADKAAEAFADRARAFMAELQDEGVAAPAVGVIVNRVRLAREVFERLAPRDDDAPEAALFIGPARSADRDAAAKTLAGIATGNRPSWAVGGSSSRKSDLVGRQPDMVDLAARRRDLFDAAAEPTGEYASGPPLFVVGTSSLEVGADFDLDALVTQAAPLDALRQRFGRLNRAGREIAARAAILVVGEGARKTPPKDDPVYGDRISNTVEWLEREAKAAPLDFGIDAMDARLAPLSAAERARLVAPRTDAPVLMPAYLDLWSRTAPVPRPDSEISLFLHGAEREPASVSLVWRADLTEADLRGGTGADIAALLALMPPRAAEAIALPLWAVRRWLRRGERADDLADAPARAPEAEGGGGHLAFRWAGADDPRTGPVVPDALRSGDALVVPAAYGGCDAWGWNPDSRAPAADVADAAARPFAGRRFVVRVHEGLAGEAWDRLAAALAERAEDRPAALVQALLDAGPEPPLGEALRALRDDRRKGPRARLERPRFVHGEADDRPRGVVLVAPRGLEGAVDVERDARPTTEDDAAGSRTRGEPLPLDRHCGEVAAKALGFAQAMGLATALGADLALAGFLHDAGKADRRFQAMLAGGDRLNLPDAPLAKSARAWGPDAGTRAGLPERWRHEALSVRLAPLHPRFAEAADPALVLWLIGTHHGRGRPFFPHADDQDRWKAARRGVLGCLGVAPWPLEPGPGPQDLGWTLEAGDPLDGSDWARLFAGLRRRYGVWGLARLEAALRLADHRASEAEEGAP